jgi:hypothetical protein
LLLPLASAVVETADLRLIPAIVGVLYARRFPGAFAELRLRTFLTGRGLAVH